MSVGSQALTGLALRYPLVLSALGLAMIVLGALILQSEATVPADGNGSLIDARLLNADVPEGKFVTMANVEWTCRAEFKDEETSVVPGFIDGRRRVFAKFGDQVRCGDLGSVSGTVRNIWPAFSDRLESAGIRSGSSGGSTLEFLPDPGGQNARLNRRVAYGFCLMGLVFAILGVCWWRRPPYWQRVYRRLSEPPANMDPVVLPTANGSETVPFAEFRGTLESESRLARLGTDQLKAYLTEAVRRSMWGEIEVVANAAIDRSPDDDQVVCDVAIAWIMSGKARRAQGLLERLSRTRPLGSKLIATKAFLRLELGHDRDAAQLAQMALAGNPSESVALEVMDRLEGGNHSVNAPVPR